MSFSGKVKEELARVCPRARHCRLAELAAITGMCGEWREEEGRLSFPCALGKYCRREKMLYIDRKNL